MIKQAWSLASEKFPKAKSLYVDVPAVLRGDGACQVFDLDKPELPLGSLNYTFKCEDGHPILSLSVGGSATTKIAIQRQSSSFAVASELQQLEPKNAISAVDIMAQYTDLEALGEQLALLMVGHDDGPIKTAEVEENEIDQWMSQYGFKPEVFASVKGHLENLGIKVAKRPTKKRFENYEKVRVVDPRIMEYNEGAKVLNHRRNKDKKDFYEVIVDGSEKPIWLSDLQLAPNQVGSLKEISSIDRKPE